MGFFEERCISMLDPTSVYLEKCKCYMTNIISAEYPLSQRHVDVYNYILTLK